MSSFCDNDPSIATRNKVIKEFLNTVSIYKCIHIKQVNKSKQPIITHNFIRQAEAELQQEGII